jgi:hypothetical protein
MLLHLVACPDPACGAVAEIAGHVRAGSAGATVHFKTRCLRRHVFIVPADQIVHIELPEYRADRPGRSAAGPPRQV